MKNRLIYTIFLLGLTSGEVFADSPLSLSCSGTASAACTAAVTVYNSIMSNAVATSALAGMATTVQNTTQDPMYVAALSMLSTNPRSGLTNYVDNCQPTTTTPMSPACQAAVNAYNSLQKAVGSLNTNLQKNANNLSTLVQDITGLATSSGKLGIFQSSPETVALGGLIQDLNAFDVAESTAAGIHIPSEEAKRSVPAKR